MRVNMDGSVHLDGVEAIRVFACVQADIISRMKTIEATEDEALKRMLMNDLIPRLRMCAEWAEATPLYNHAIDAGSILRTYRRTLLK